MFFSAWRAERSKLKHSPVWLAFFLLPLIPAFFGTINYLNNLTILDDLWYSLWTQHTLFSCYFFLPLVIGIYCAYLWRLEHTGHNWNLVLTVPISRTVLILAKLANAAVLTVFIVLWSVLLYIISGILCGLGTNLPLYDILCWTFGGICGGIVICAVQLFLALVIRSFAVAVGIALIGGLSGLATIAKGYPYINPYSLLCLGMKANNPNQNVNYMLFTLSCICFFSLFLILSILYLKYLDAKTV